MRKKKPTICILASRQEGTKDVFPEALRFLRFADAFHDDARFILADGQDAHQNDERLQINRGLEVVDGTITSLRYKRPLEVDYLYKTMNGKKTRQISDTETEFERLKRIRKFAEANGIPVNNTTDLSLTCRYKSETEKVLSAWEDQTGIEIPRIQHFEVQGKKELVDILRERNEAGLDTLLKPDADSLGNGIAIIKGSKNAKELEMRLKGKDIRKIFARMSAGESFLYCDYLTETYTLHGRKTELRLYVVPFSRDAQTLGAHYAGCVVLTAPQLYDPSKIEDRDKSLTFLRERERRRVTLAGYALEETILYTDRFYAALMRNATAVVNALFHNSKDKNPCLAYVSFDYLLSKDGNPLFLEANSRGGFRIYDDQHINEYTERHLFRTLFPEIIHQAKQYQQRRQQ